MKPVGRFMLFCWYTTRVPGKTGHGTSRSWPPTLWPCKVSSVNAAPVVTGCAPIPHVLPALLCSTAMQWAQPSYGTATILEGRKAIQSKELWARANRGNLSTSAGNSDCLVYLLLPPLWFSVCFACVLKQPRVSCLPPKGARVSAASDPATKLGPPVECRAWGRRLRGTFDGEWCCHLLTRELLNGLFMPQLPRWCEDIFYLTLWSSARGWGSRFGFMTYFSKAGWEGQFCFGLGKTQHLLSEPVHVGPVGEAEGGYSRR